MDNRQINFQDGAYENLVTGVGSMLSDKTEHDHVRPVKLLDYKTIGYIYANDGLGKRIVNKVADGALFHGFAIDGDEKGKLYSIADKVIGQNKFIEASRATRRAGGALMLLRVADNQELDVPIGRGAIVGASVHSAGMIQLIDFKKDTDEPEFFTIVFPNGNVARVHESRVIQFFGDKLPDEIASFGDIRQMFFGVGALQGLVSGLSKFDIAITETVNLLAESNIRVTSIDGFNNLLSQNKEDAQRILACRTRANKLSMSVLRQIIQDKNDSTTIQTNSFAGIDSCILAIQRMVSAVSGLSMSAIFGESASGLNATGEGDKKNDNDVIKAWQSYCLSAPMSKLFRLLNEHNGGGLNTGDPCSITFAPLYQPTPSETADIQQKNAVTLKTLWECEALDANQIRAIISNGGLAEPLNISLSGIAK